MRRPGLYLGVAAAGAVLVNVLAGAEPAAQAEGTATAPVSVADQLGLTGPERADGTPDLQPLEQLAASRSTREAERAAAQQVQAAADRAATDKAAMDEAAADKAAADKAAMDEAAAEKAAAEKAAAEKAGADQAAADRAHAAAAAPAPASSGRSASAAGTAGSGAVARISNTAGPVKPAAQAAADVVVSSVPGAASITIGGTRPSAADPHGHPSGLALDYMVNADEALGDAIVAFHIAHWDELGVEYVIWQQRMLSSPGGSWKPMEDRGSPTANHMDHPHVNYDG